MEMVLGFSCLGASGRRWGVRNWGRFESRAGGARRGRLTALAWGRSLERGGRGVRLGAGSQGVRNRGALH